MIRTVQESLAHFIRRAEANATGGEFPRERFDPEWVSPCQKGEPDESGMIRWAPVPQPTPRDFRGLENALELKIHPDIQAYYSAYWSAGLEAQAEEGAVTLIQLWNNRDFDRLIENLIGHALAKRRARLPLTLFFATTDPDSELILSIDNSSGEVVLEEPGRAPERIVQRSLAPFIDRLTPSAVQPRIY